MSKHHTQIWSLNQTKPTRETGDKEGITLGSTATRNLCLRRQREDWPRLEETWRIQEPHRISSGGYTMFEGRVRQTGLTSDETL